MRRKSLFAVIFFCLQLQVKAQETQPVFIASPYLQIGENPQPGSIEILWQTNAETHNWLLEVKNAGGNGWRACDPPTESWLTPTEMAPRQLWRCRIKGLDPLGSFDYRLSRDGQYVFQSSGKPVLAEGRPYRFVVFGDIGAGGRDSKLVAMAVGKAAPDLAIVPGDIIYDRGRLSEYDQRFWPIYNADTLNQNGAPLLRSFPFVAAPGNHDTEVRDFEKYPDALAYFLCWSQPLNGPGKKAGGPAFPAVPMGKKTRDWFPEAAGKRFPAMANFSFDYADAHWLFLDANNYVEWQVKKLQQWVEKDLASARNKRWKFVVFHQPGFSSSREHFEQQQMRLLAPVFEKGGVDIVFMGHVHNYQRSFPLRFQPEGRGRQLVGGREGLTPKGRVVDGQWTIDRDFDGQQNTRPKGVIYIVTGAGGQILYDIDQEKQPGTWQPFTARFISSVHSITVVDMNADRLQLKQETVDGVVLDSIEIRK